MQQKAIEALGVSEKSRERCQLIMLALFLLLASACQFSDTDSGTTTVVIATAVAEETAEATRDSAAHETPYPHMTPDIGSSGAPNPTLLAQTIAAPPSRAAFRTANRTIPSFLLDNFRGEARCPAPCIEGVYLGQPLAETEEVLGRPLPEVGAGCPEFMCHSWTTTDIRLLSIRSGTGDMEGTISYMEVWLREGFQVSAAIDALGEPEMIRLMTSQWMDDTWLGFAELLYPDTEIAVRVELGHAGFLPDSVVEVVTFADTSRYLAECPIKSQMFPWRGYGYWGLYATERFEKDIDPLFGEDACGRHACIINSMGDMLPNPAYGNETCGSTP